MSEKPYLIDLGPLSPEQLRDLNKVAGSELVQSMQPMLKDAYKGVIRKAETLEESDRTKSFLDRLDYSEEDSTYKY